MGSTQSVQLPSEDEDEDEDEEEEEGDGQGGEAAEEGDGHNTEEEERRALTVDGSKKVLQQEPEMLPCHASASPLSPQPSAFGTPRMGPCPSIKVWDPFNVLAPSPSYFPRSFSEDDRLVTELILISNGECHMNLRPDLIAGRCPDAALTPNGKRQARALAIFLKSQGVRFAAVYTSPLDRARATAVSVCQVTSAFHAPKFRLLFHIIHSKNLLTLFCTSFECLPYCKFTILRPCLGCMHPEFLNYALPCSTCVFSCISIISFNST